MSRTIAAVSILVAITVLPALASAQTIRWSTPSSWDSERSYNDETGLMNMLVLEDAWGEERIAMTVVSNLGDGEYFGLGLLSVGLSWFACDTIEKEIVTVGDSMGSSTVSLCRVDGESMIMETVKATVGGLRLDFRYVSESLEDHEDDQATFRRFLKRMSVQSS